MFHAVSQMPSEDLGSPGTGALPMFREHSSSSGRGSSSSSISGNSRSRRPNNEQRRAQQLGGSGSGPTASGSAVADAAAGGDIRAGAAPVNLEMRPLQAAPRRRRSGALKDMIGGRAAASAGGAAVLSSNNASPVGFAKPDGLDAAGSFAEAGTFRWDATVADAATAQQDEMSAEEGLEEDGGGGGNGGSDNRRSGMDGGVGGGGGSRRGGGGMGVRRSGKLALSPPLSGDMVDMAVAPRYPGRKPWYIITPESKTHQIFDHLGESCCC